MYRKNNPWVSLVAVLLLALILAFACTGCARSTAEAAVTKNSDRFTFERHFYGSWPDCYVITDNATGIQYLLVTTSNGCGLTKLEE